MLLIVVDTDMFILLSYREQRGELAWKCASPGCACDVYAHILSYLTASDAKV